MTSSGDRRSSIIRAALRILTEKGASALTVRNIADEAGMSKSSAHRVFPSQHHILAALLTHLYRADLEQFMEKYPISGEAGESFFLNRLKHIYDASQSATRMDRAIIELRIHIGRIPEMHSFAMRHLAQRQEITARLIAADARALGYELRGSSIEASRSWLAFEDGIALGFATSAEATAIQDSLDETLGVVQQLIDPVGHLVHVLRE